VSGQRRNPNVSNLELQPVTCGRLRGERAFPRLQRINSFASCLISAVQRITSFPSPPSFWPINHSQINLFVAHLLSLHLLHTCLLQSPLPIFHAHPFAYSTPCLALCPSNLLEGLSASQTLGLSLLLREWLDKPYTTSNAFSLPLSACQLTGPG
jgi:hypothetical protein